MPRVLILFVVLLSLTACMPAPPSLQLPQDCRAQQSIEKLLATDWLAGEEVWRIRQTALLETRFRKLAMEGFLRLDLKTGEARLVALNEIGLVLFDLQVTADSEQLHRAVPPLEKRRDLMTTIAKSLRRIFLVPRPALSDRLVPQENVQSLSRISTNGSQNFLFDCYGDLRESRWQGEAGSWSTHYNHYDERQNVRLPEEIILHDEEQGVRLTLEIKEVKPES